MKKEMNPKLLGVFVLSGVAVFISMILFFTSLRIFQETEDFVMYFDGSLNGLQVGAPVKFRGVKIGMVSQIKVVLDYNTKSISLPVYVTLEPERLDEVGTPVRHTEYALMKEFIKRGLRGRLSTQSLVTGMLYVELDTFPNTDIKLTGLDPQHFEVPTIPSRAEELSGMLTTAKSTLNRVKQLIDSQKIDRAIDDFSSIMSTGKDTMVDLQSAAASGKTAFKDVQLIAGKVNNRTQPIMVRFEEVLNELKDTLASIKTVTDYLARHPEALIRGKATAQR